MRQTETQIPVEETLEEAITLNTPKRFINRELSWLQFNHRVLEEALNPNHPLLERVRFLSISASNLDEFFMVRVAGVKAQIHRGAASASPDAMTPAEQLAAIEKAVVELNQMTRECIRTLTRDLEAANIFITKPDQLNQEDIDNLLKGFQTKIFPVLSPLAVDPAHPFPFIPNLGHGMILDLTDNTSKDSMFALVILPQQLKRYIRLPGDKARFIRLVSVVRMFYDHLFPGYTLEGSGVFQLIRDSEIEIDEAAEDLVRTFQSALNRRRRGNVIRLRVDTDMPDNLTAFITEQFEMAAEDVFKTDHVELTAIKEVITDDRPDLIFKKISCQIPGTDPGFRRGLF